MDYKDLPYVVEPMQSRHLQQVMEIERRSFPTPWPAHVYRHELRFNELANYFIVQSRSSGDSEASSRTDGETFFTRLRNWFHGPRGDRRVLGYGGFWLLEGEAHISTVAVRPDFRRRGVGELLLVAMMDKAMEKGASMISLEVRASNTVAQSLYHKYGFQQVGRKTGYYSDNEEDGLVMHRERVWSPEKVSELNELKEALRRKLKQRYRSSDERPAYEHGSAAS